MLAPVSLIIISKLTWDDRTSDKAHWRESRSAWDVCEFRLPPEVCGLAAAMVRLGNISTEYFQLHLSFLITGGLAAQTLHLYFLQLDFNSLGLGTTNQIISIMKLNI